MAQHICPIKDCNQGKIINSKTLAKDNCETCRGTGYITQEQYEVAVENFTGKKTTSVVDEYIVKDSANVYSESGKLIKRYYWVDDSSEGLATVKLEDNGKWVFIDTTGNVVVPRGKYDWVGDFSEGPATVKFEDKGKWGFIDTTGKEVIPLGKFDWVGDFSEGLCKVRLDGKWGFIDTTGFAVVPPKYDRVSSFSEEGLAVVRLDRKCCFIDTTGNVVIPHLGKYGRGGPHGWAYRISEDFAVIWVDGKYSLLADEVWSGYSFINKASEWLGGPEEPPAPSGGCLWVVVFFTTLLTLACNY